MVFMQFKERDKKTRLVGIFLTLYVSLFVYGAFLLATPPAKLPLLFLLLALALVSLAAGSIKTKAVSVILVLLTLLLILKEISDGSKYRAVLEYMQKRQINTSE
jgi:hypothetical protein